MIKLSQVTKQFKRGVTALGPLTTTIERGEWVFVTGPSGAGKTTLMHIIFGVISPSFGHVEVGGLELTSASDAQLRLFRRTVGFVFQNARLLEEATVFENVSLPLQIRGFSDPMIEKLVYTTLEQLELASLAQERARELSGGEKQKVALARAVVTKPELLLADEPTGNLDQQSGALIMELFRRAHVQGTTLLMATHDENWLMRYPKRTLVLSKGVLNKDSHHGLRI